MEPSSLIPLKKVLRIAVSVWAISSLRVFDMLVRSVACSFWTASIDEVAKVLNCSVSITDSEPFSSKPIRAERGMKSSLSKRARFLFCCRSLFFNL